MPEIFRLKVRLADIEPEIWRRIVVSASHTLTELHAVIQGALGWQDYHLHMFEIADDRYEIPEQGLEPETGWRDEGQHRIGELLSVGMEFSYVYDFGDDWLHRVTVEDRQMAAPGEPAPLCVDGARACPPEDCGGPFAYPEFLQALNNSDHPEHEDMVEWAGGYEPELFDVAQANKLIQVVCALYRERGLGFNK